MKKFSLSSITKIILLGSIYNHSMLSVENRNLKKNTSKDRTEIQSQDYTINLITRSIINNINDIISGLDACTQNKYFDNVTKILEKGGDNFIFQAIRALLTILNTNDNIKSIFNTTLKEDISHIIQDIIDKLKAQYKSNTYNQQITLHLEELSNIEPAAKPTHIENIADENTKKILLSILNEHLLLPISQKALILKNTINTQIYKANIQIDQKIEHTIRQIRRLPDQPQNTGTFEVSKEEQIKHAKELIVNLKITETKCVSFFNAQIVIRYIQANDKPDADTYDFYKNILLIIEKIMNQKNTFAENHDLPISLNVLYNHVKTRLNKNLSNPQDAEPIPILFILLLGQIISRDHVMMLTKNGYFNNLENMITGKGNDLSSFYKLFTEYIFNNQNGLFYDSNNKNIVASLLNQIINVINLKKQTKIDDIFIYDYAQYLDDATKSIEKLNTQNKTEQELRELKKNTDVISSVINDYKDYLLNYLKTHSHDFYQAILYLLEYNDIDFKATEYSKSQIKSFDIFDLYKEMINIVESLNKALHDNKEQLITKESNDYLDKADLLFNKIKTDYSDLTLDSFKLFGLLEKDDQRKVILLSNPAIFYKRSIKNYFDKQSLRTFLTLLKFLVQKKIDILKSENSNLLIKLKNYLWKTQSQLATFENLLKEVGELISLTESINIQSETNSFQQNTTTPPHNIPTSTIWQKIRSNIPIANPFNKETGVKSWFNIYEWAKWLRFKQP